MDFALLPAVFIRLFTNPLEPLRRFRDETSYGFPLLFAVLMGTLAALLSLVVKGDQGVQIAAGGSRVAVVIGGAVFGLVWAGVGAVIVHVLARLAGGTGDFVMSFHVNAFAMATLPVANALAFSSLLSALPLLYGTVLVGLGIAEMHDAGRTRVLLTVGLVCVVGVGGLGGLTWLALRKANTVMTQMDQAEVQVREEQASVLREAIAAEAERKAAPLAVAPPPPLKWAVKVNSVPPGAEIARMPGGAPLGKAPATLSFEGEAERVELRLRLGGVEVLKTVTPETAFLVVPLGP